MKDIPVEKNDFATRAVKQRINNILEGQIKYITENNSYSNKEKESQINFIKTLQEQTERSDKKYIDKVFDDVVKTLGESTIKNVKTNADGFTGLELLGNFHQFIEHYEDTRELLKEVKDYKKAQKIMELANENGIDTTIKDLEYIISKRKNEMER